MKYKRFYFEKESLKDNLIVFSGEEFLHAFVVLRLKVGDEMCLFCGDGKDYICQVDKIEKKQAILKVLFVNENDCEPTCNLTIYQALVKGEKLNLIAQKLTELGVMEFKTFYSNFCDVKPNTTKLEKLNSIVISACKQCGRSKLMKIYPKVLTVNEVASELANFEKVYVAYENEKENNFVESLIEAKNKGIKNIAIIVGAEGGFSEEEIRAFEKQNAEIVTLGKLILRAETCSILASGLAMQIL